jgi:hypothetical protein
LLQRARKETQEKAGDSEKELLKKRSFACAKGKLVLCHEVGATFGPTLVTRRNQKLGIHALRRFRGEI